MMNQRLYTTSYNKPQVQQFETAVLSFIKLQYTEKSCKMINIFVLVTILGHLPVILSAKSKGSENMEQILIVEDDSFLNKMLDYNLTADGYGVTSALNARTAADAIRQRKFDLVLLDINLPDGNGFELCKLIKPQHPDTIVIFLTANDQESDQIRGYEVGAVDYITKPFVIGALQRKIKAMFANVGTPQTSQGHLRRRAAVSGLLGADGFLKRQAPDPIPDGVQNAEPVP